MVKKKCVRVSVYISEQNLYENVAVLYFNFIFFFLLLFLFLCHFDIYFDVYSYLIFHNVNYFEVCIHIHFGPYFY